MNRRDAVGVLGALSLTVGRAAVGQRQPPSGVQSEPTLAPGAPNSAERLALIDSFKKRSAGLDQRFEARTHASDWTMPYRLFRPDSSGSHPLVVYLHGSGGLGTDNQRQMGLGNTFGTRVWALPEHQARFPCFVLAPQTDRGWIRYAPASPGDTVAKPIPGLGDGARLVLELVESLRREFPIDRSRIYLTGQSMGGAGVWNLTAQPGGPFAAAVVCCGSASADDAADSRRTPVWNFHGDADATVAPATSRARIAALRAAGATPVATEYAGVGHNVWEWAYTEPALVPWLFGHRLTG